MTDMTLCRDFGLVETVNRAVAGGVCMVQLRAKDSTTPERIEMARALKAALIGTGVPLIMNDDLDAAIHADCDGAHIGQGDISPTKARGLLGAEKTLGLSCETPQTVMTSDPTIVDYLGLGPVFGTHTKKDHETPIGFAGLARLVGLTALPTVAIGGLKAAHQAQVLASGADGLAVVSAICGQADPKAAAQMFNQVGVTA
ncbi:MAG: thiamine phosphate synthase [Roseobacter sp.]